MRKFGGKVTRYPFIYFVFFYSLTAEVRQKMELLMDHLLICQTGVMQVLILILKRRLYKVLKNRAEEVVEFVRFAHCFVRLSAVEVNTF